MAQRKLKRGSNLDGTYYPPGSMVDGDVFTNPKLYVDPEDGSTDDEDEGTVDVLDDPPVTTAAAKKAAKKAASSSS